MSTDRFPPDLAGDRRMRSARSTRRLAVAGALLVVLAVVVGGRPAAAPDPLDPTSAAPDGLLGLVRLLEGRGVEVAVTDVLPGDPADPHVRVLVPLDVRDEQRRRRLERYLEAGGTVVVAGSGAAWTGLAPAPAPVGDALGSVGRPAGCSLAALDAVERAEHRGWAGYEVPTSATGCFLTGSDPVTAWLVVQRRGAGTLVTIGSASPLTNALLDRADNAVLAAALLGPPPGDRLVVLPRPPVGAGEVPLATLLGELLPVGTAAAALLLALAAVLAVVARARRLGAPVPDPRPPVLPAAELASSLATLIERSGGRADAARRLRQALRRELAVALGRVADAPSEQLLAAVAARTGLDPAVVSTALLDAPVVDDHHLGAVADATAQVRAALNGTRPPADAAGESDIGAGPDRAVPIPRSGGDR